MEHIAAKRWTIRIRKKGAGLRMVSLLCIAPYLIASINSGFLGLPTFLKYFFDVLSFALLFLLVVNQKSLLKNTSTKVLLIWAISFFLYTGLVYIDRYQSVVYYIWGLRNNFRFYIFFFACIAYLSVEDIKNYLKLLDKLLVLNALIMVLQYFVFEKKGDFIGGLFGVTRGCNGYLNIFLSVVTVKATVFFFNKEEKGTVFIGKLGLVLISAVIAELKFFFFEFIVIILIASMVVRFSFGKLFIMLGAILAVVVCISLLGQIFPLYANFFTYDNIMDYVSVDGKAGYSFYGGFNRVGAISLANRRFLTTPDLRLFGLGLGNSDYSNVEAFVTPFYKLFGKLNYVWFSIPFMYLENGIIGLVFYIAFFLLVGIHARKQSKANCYDQKYRQITEVVAFCSILFMIYDVSLRTEAGFMVYMLLSFAFIQNPKGIDRCAAIA